MDETKLAFLSRHSFDNDSCIRGGILITDANTKPLEFRVTAPIKPTTFQKTLYGKILEQFIAVELIGVPIINSVKGTPDYILVRDSHFLGINEQTSLKVIRLYKENEVQYAKTQKENQQLTSTSGNYEPVFFETTSNLEPELPEIRKKLMEIFSTSDLLEPFDRVKIAIQEVHSKKMVE